VNVSELELLAGFGCRTSTRWHGKYEGNMSVLTMGEVGRSSAEVRPAAEVDSGGEVSLAVRWLGA
jgi:hypothetical protein